MITKKLAFFAWILSFGFLSCSHDPNTNLLDRDRPITVTVWHYYNGNIKESFDQLVAEFNETIGMDKGIVIDAQSQGDVNQLAAAVFDSANKSIGSVPMPDIFASYPDNAFRVNQTTKLVPLDRYFSDSELAEFRAEFLEEGRFITDNHFYIVPIAKSTENLYVNKTYWEPFAQRHGYTSADLATWEGLARVGQAYWEETGRGFFGIDANANYMLVSSRQLGGELFSYSTDGTATFQFPQTTAKKIWDGFYVPYLKGYFVKSGRFSSDDAKKGAVLAYTGSTAGAAYFPSSVAFSETEVRTIEPLVLPYPVFSDGELVSIQQGAGMCIAQSDAAHEYAAAVFLKWFTSTKQNLAFAVSTGYWPVKTEAIPLVEKTIAGKPAVPAPVFASFQTTAGMFQKYKLYNSKPFQGSFDARVFLENALISKVGVDLELVKKEVQGGRARDAVLEELTSSKAFVAWYDHLKKQATLVLKKD